MAKVDKTFFKSGRQGVIRLMTPLRMSYEESYVRGFPFDKMVNAMLDPEIIEGSRKIVNEAIEDNIQVNPIINNRAGGNATLIAQRIADGPHLEKQQRLL